MNIKNDSKKDKKIWSQNNLAEYARDMLNFHHRDKAESLYAVFIKKMTDINATYVDWRKEIMEILEPLDMKERLDTWLLSSELAYSWAGGLVSDGNLDVLFLEKMVERINDEKVFHNVK